MQAKSLPLLTALSLTAFVIPALGQATGSSRTPVQHPPFTAEFKMTSVQTLSDGTTITRETTEVQARDSSSRSMTSNHRHDFGRSSRRHAGHRQRSRCEPSHLLEFAHQKGA